MKFIQLTDCYSDDRPMYVNLAHVSCILEDDDGKAILQMTDREDSLCVNESVQDVMKLVNM